MGRRSSPKTASEDGSVSEPVKKRRPPTEGKRGRPGVEAFQDPALREDYEARQGDLDLFPLECACARQSTGLTQKEVAERMGTTGSAIARLETYQPGRKNAPTLETLRRYAQALDCTLILRLEPHKKQGKP